MRHLEAIHTVSSTVPLIKKVNYLKSAQKYVVVTHLSNILDMCRFISYMRLMSELGGFLSRLGYSTVSLNKNGKKMPFSAFEGAKCAKNFTFRAIFWADKWKFTYRYMFHSHFKGVRPIFREKVDFTMSTSQPTVHWSQTLNSKV